VPLRWTERLPDLRRVRGVADKLTTPLHPDDYLSQLNPLWSARELRGRVEQVVPETDDAATLVIRPGWGWTFGYRPGQYVGIGVEVDGRFHWRSYSLSSPPRRDRRLLTITVKAMPEGFLSAHLVRGLAPGTIVRLAPPQGDFVLPDPPPERLLFVVGGSGITPVMAMLRAMVRRDELPDVVHVHSAPTAEDVMFGDELSALHESHPNFVSQVQHTRTGGRFQLADLDALYPDWRERQTWACGPTPMLDEIERVWQEEGLADRLHTERFAISRADDAGQGGTVTFTKTGRSIEIDGATTLLEAGEKVGVQMPFGCRMGICQTCVVPLVAGHTRDLRSGREHGEGERVQTCIASAAGDCTFDL
jgi:ferredoxin-NADP reductase